MRDKTMLKKVKNEQYHNIKSSFKYFSIYNYFWIFYLFLKEENMFYSKYVYVTL